MPNPPPAPPVNPHWLAFFRRVRQEAQRLDALERDRAAERTPAPPGTP